jgi:hypothetical protein
LSIGNRRAALHWKCGENATDKGAVRPLPASAWRCTAAVSASVVEEGNGSFCERGQGDGKKRRREEGQQGKTTEGQ